MPTILSTLADTEIRMRYREPFLTEGLDLKLAVNTPPGIYRGFRLTTSGSALTVGVLGDSVFADHAAVYQAGTGHSLTIRRVGSTFNFDLSGYASKTVVLAIYCTYLLGSPTTGEFRAYELSPTDEFTGAAERPELVVIGTVVVPAAGLIPAANITHARRVSAWATVAPEATTWHPVIENGSFEWADNTQSYPHAMANWEIGTGPTNGSFRASDGFAGHTGSKALQLNVTASPVSAFVTQRVLYPVPSGRLVRVVLWVRSLIAPTGSVNINLWLNWAQSDGVPVSNTQVPLVVVGATDGAYRVVDQIVTVPANRDFLHSIDILALGQTYGSTGVALLVDDVQVFVEVPGALETRPPDTRMGTPNLASIVLDDPSGLDSAQIAALLRYEKAAPAGEGTVYIERKDQNNAGLPPALAVLGRLSLGANLLGSETDALKARLTSLYGIAGGIDYTLLWASPPVSGSTATMRGYVSPTGNLVWTTNARWGSPTANQWNKDVNGSPAIKVEQRGDRFEIYSQIGSNNTWLDNAWQVTTTFLGALTSALGGAVNIPRAGIGADNGIFIGPDGRIIRPFRTTRYDSVTYDLLNSLCFWGDDSVNGGQVYLGNSDGEAVLKVETGSLLNQRASVNQRGGDGGTTGRGPFPVSTRPGFTAKFRFSSSLLNREDFIGFTDGGQTGSSFMCAVMRDTALGTSLRVAYEDTTNADFNYDTGFSPALDVWYYVTLIVLNQSPGSFLFRIGTTPDWRPGDTVTIQSTGGNGDLQPDNSGFNWRFGVSCQTTAAAIKWTEISWVEVFATKEWA